MSAGRRALVACLALLAAAIGLAGCGLKGPLTLPEKSKNVVIRGQQTGAGGQPAPASATPAGAPPPEKLPPPELPRSPGNAGRG